MKFYGATMNNRNGVIKGNIDDVHQIVNKIKCVIFDVDGVFTDNRVPEGGDSKMKYRSYYDGQGVSLLRAIGIRVCLVTNEKDASAKHIVDVVEKWNKLPSSLSSDNPNGWAHVCLFTNVGGGKKSTAVEQWLNEFNLKWSDCGVMGDDLVDYSMFKLAAFRAVPISGELVLQDEAHFISRRSAGNGAVRDLVNFILEEKGINSISLPFQ